VSNLMGMAYWGGAFIGVCLGELGHPVAAAFCLGVGAVGLAFTLWQSH